MSPEGERAERDSELRWAGVVRRHRRPISIVLQDLSGGGAERMMANLAAGIAAMGVPVDMVMVRREGSFLRDLPEEVRVVDLGTRRVAWSVPALARYLRRVRPTAVLSTLVHMNVAALLARRLSGTSTRVVVREANLVSANRRYLAYPLVRLAYRAMPWVYPWADAVVAVSDDVAVDLAEFVKIPDDRLFVLKNPVVTARLREGSVEPVNHPWLRERSVPLVMGAGRFVEQKDFRTLIRAFRLLRDKRDARLVILGEGPERQRLEALVHQLGLQDDVLLPGFVDNVHEWIAGASVFALSSRWEGSPNVLVEALALGVPVVSTDCSGGSREILAHGSFGTLVPVADPEAMASGLRQLLEHGADPTRLRSRALDYSVDRSAAAYLEVLLGGAPRAGEGRSERADQSA
jgi:glycosyltransferase involved in cell wall biosynthesis